MEFFSPHIYWSWGTCWNMGLDQEGSWHVQPVQSTGASGAYGTFACANVNNTSEDEAAIMKVFMQ